MNYFAVQTRKQEIVEKRIAEYERVQARGKLSLSQKALSGVLFERGIDAAGFSRIVSKGDEALFGGSNTQDMKDRLGVPDSRPLADFLPTITIKAKDFANEVTHTQVKQYDLRDEPAVTSEHVRNNADVRRILTDRDIRPEALAARGGCPQSPTPPQGRGTEAASRREGEALDSPGRHPATPRGSRHAPHPVRAVAPARSPRPSPPIRPRSRSTTPAAATPMRGKAASA
jgi:hypothetical protein